MSCKKHGYTNGVYCPVCDKQLADAYNFGREEGLKEIESWKIRYQDADAIRAEAENDLYAMQQERRREHSLRVKFAGEAESYRKLLMSVRETLYCTGMAPHEYDADHHCSHCGVSSAHAKDMIDEALSAVPSDSPADVKSAPQSIG